MEASILSGTFAACVAGIASIPHCALMCGPIKAWACSSKTDPSSQPFSSRLPLSQLGFHVARLCSYAGVGALAVYFRRSLSQAIDTAMLSKSITLLASAVLLYAAFRQLWPSHKGGVANSGSGGLVELQRIPPRNEPVSRGTLAQLQRFRAPLAGLALGFLPCGALAAGLLIAAMGGTLLEGSLRMVVFGISSASGLVLFSVLASRLRYATSKWAPRLLAFSFTVSAALLVFTTLPGASSDRNLNTGETVGGHPAGTAPCPLHRSSATRSHEQEGVGAWQ